MSCAVNAASGREQVLDFRPVETRKHVVVVGAGPAGMECARVACERGHRVTLLERRRRLGGSLVLAATVHGDNERFLDYLRGEMERLAIDVRLGFVASADSVAALVPDEVVVATGARLQFEPVPGMELDHVLLGSHVRQLIDGAMDTPIPALPAWLNVAARGASGLVDRYSTPARLRWAANWWLPVGQRVAVVGGDLAALEIAEFLARRGRDVALLERASQIAPEIGPKRRLEHEKRLEALQVTINTGVSIARIEREAVMLALPGGRSAAVNADSVIITGEPVADHALYDALAAAGLSCHRAGDCNGLGLIANATLEGSSVAHSL